MPKEVIQRISELQQQGMKARAIHNQLLKEGYSAKQINDAINQQQTQSQFQSSTNDIQTQQQTSQPQGMQGMQPSMGSQGQEQQTPSPQQSQQAAQQQKQQSQEQVPQPGQQVQQSQYPQASQQATQDYSEEQQGYPYQYGQDNYQQGYENYNYGQGTAETIEELTEEIINEKWEEFKDKIGDVGMLKKELSSRIDHLNDRVKRVEVALDKLETAMIGKVSEYGKGIKSVGSDVQALHNAFSKILNPLVDNVKQLNNVTNKLEKISGKKSESKGKIQPKTKKKKTKK